MKTIDNKWDEFKKGYYHMGYYLDAIGIDCLHDFKNPEWDFDTDEEYSPGFAYELADTFVMGACNIFALALAKNISIQTYNWFSKSGTLIHAFGMMEYNGNTAYVDARGATTDFDEFTDPLKVPDDEPFLPIPQDVEAEYEALNKDGIFGFRFAEKLIIENRGCYPSL